MYIFFCVLLLYTLWLNLFQMDGRKREIHIQSLTLENGNYTFLQIQMDLAQSSMVQK